MLGSKRRGERIVEKAHLKAKNGFCQGGVTLGPLKLYPHSHTSVGCDSYL